MITIVYGDLLKATEDIIGHQVNAKSVMGSGIAMKLRNKYSNLYPSYQQYCSNYDPITLMGKCHIIKCGSKRVANLYGQLNYGRSTSIVYTDYEALRSSLYVLEEFARLNNLSVALPFNIGCGLANGDWKIVEQIIEEAFKSYQVKLYKFQ